MVAQEVAGERKGSASRCLAPVLEHPHQVPTVSFRPDSRILASGTLNGAIKFWDVRDGSCVHTLHVPGPYKGMNITGVTGISEAQRAALMALGAVEH